MNELIQKLEKNIIKKYNRSFIYTKLSEIYNIKPDLLLNINKENKKLNLLIFELLCYNKNYKLISQSHITFYDFNKNKLITLLTNIDNFTLMFIISVIFEKKNK